MYASFAWTDVAEARNRITRRFEPIQPFLLLELARAAGSEAFIDVGANIGLYSVFLSSLPSIERITAFEAAPATFEALRAVVDANGLAARMDLRNLAVSASDAPVTFGIMGPVSGANGVVDTTIHKTARFSGTITVASTRLDEALELRDRRICLKIDVEGHEAPVVAGAERTLAGNLCVLQIEAYGGETGAIDALAALGFRRCFAAGPDIYMTNDPALFDADRLLGVFEATGARITSQALEVYAPFYED